MAWLTALIKAILEWATGEIKKDTKAGDADVVPQDLQDRWQRRIDETLEKEQQQKRSGNRGRLTDEQKENE